MTFVEPGFNKFDKRKLISAAFQAKMPLFLLRFIGAVDIKVVCGKQYKSLKDIAEGGNISPEPARNENKFPVHLEPHSYKVFKLSVYLHNRQVKKCQYET